MTGETPHPPGPDRRHQPDALDRLRAADPARDVDPDLGRLRAAVAARLDAPPPVETTASSGSGATAPAGRRSGVRARWFAVAAVTAGALVVGGAGFGLGAVTGGRTAGDVVTLAAGAPSTAELSTGADTAIYPPWPTRVVFTASGLSDATTTAPAWGLDAAGAFTAESAERAARALGLEGDAVLQAGSWVVGATDGRGPSLTLSPDGQASVSYHDPTKDPYLCGTAAARQDAAASGIRCAEPAEGSAPRGAAAGSIMRDLLAAMGIDGRVEIETTEYDVPETGGPRMTQVTAYLVLDGTRAGLTWTATLVGNGTQSFYGPMAALVPLGDYEVVSESEAVRRLGDPRFGFSGGPVIALEGGDAADGSVSGTGTGTGTGTGSGTGAGAETGATGEAGETGATAGAGAGAETGATGETGETGAAPDPAVGESDRAAESTDPAPGVPGAAGGSGDPSVPAAPEPGSTIPWPVTQVTITQARLGLAQQTLPDGATVLLPAYELADADGRTWSVLGVADSALDFTQAE